ncbi:3-oxoacyl-[acyl-carrier-protein] synthase II [Breoghania corrubedonensis]|uniref:3-oxoacyl-[acyl-carrier-protein] synthase 2 n=1 Tax=Breoghania corrubedonensis TaxID=665038 RepID=A0A2T5VDC2_9HYPH|nr:beta-ketoacyl-ACP synthase II [Breoghania corrubedonensis]PTW61743.1 3-oxoacyl-[acyl-carrier-protein] synthase II [Breoghania corrubedonensis]
MKRIVITGMGAVTPLGVGVDTYWKRLVSGMSGVRALTRFDASDHVCKVAAEVPSREEDPEGGFDPNDFIEPREQKRMERFIHFALAAAHEALAQARWKPETDEDREKTATIIATGIGGFPAMTAAAKLVSEKGPRRVSPFLVPSFLANLAAGQVSIRHGLRGPLGTPVTACAAGVQALGDAFRMLRTGEAEIAVAGGAEACIDPVSFAGFSAARALSTKRNDDPQAASRPFDAERDGFVMGEGAGILVLETLEHAQARGAEPIAEITGYGTTADAHHVTASPEDARGQKGAMRKALEVAGLSQSDIGYINAHSTSTPLGDAAELTAISSIFANRGKDLSISSTKSAIGHLLGAAGAVEAIAAVKALVTGIMPPSLNLGQPDEAARAYDMLNEGAKEKKLAHVLSNGFGFGGVNASVVFSKI